jgi:regulator of protease activity HflC (stomatin/prohibitin superfamily)
VDPGIIAAIVGGACAVMVLGSGLRVIAEYQRGVVLRLGRRGPLLEPGLRFILPLGVDRLVRVDLRSTVLTVAPREVFTADGVPLRVAATVHLQVLNAVLAVTRVTSYRESTLQLVEAALRDAVGRLGLRSVLVDQEAVRAAMGRFIDPRAEPWGVGVTDVDVSDIELPAAMRQAMEQQAEIRGRQQVERVRADAEVATAHRLVAAAEVLTQQPNAVQLRFLEALTQVGAERSTVVVLPLPTELVQPFVDLQGRSSSSHPGVQDRGAGGSATEPPAAQPEPVQPAPAQPRPAPSPPARPSPAADPTETTVKGRAQPR